MTGGLEAKVHEGGKQFLVGMSLVKPHMPLPGEILYRTSVRV
jgi:hypothetical protein